MKSFVNPSRPRSEEVNKYIRNNNISEYDNQNTIFCLLMGDVQKLIERVNALEEEVKHLKKG